MYECRVRTRLAIVALLGVALVAPAHALATPAISGADGDVWNAANPAPTYTITASRGSQVEVRLEGRSSGWTRGRSPLVVVLNRIGDGQYVLVARNRRDDDDDEGGGDGLARRRFGVDRVAPRVEILEPRAGAVFSLGQIVAARYSCGDAVSCVGPVPAGQPVPTDRSGPASFVVRAADAAGNESSATVAYAVGAAAATPGLPLAPVAAAGPLPAPVVVGRAKAPTPVDGVRRIAHNHKLLRPAAGSRLTTLRPVLRWRSRGGAKLYNVQVFAVRGASVRKVLSAFPASPRLRIPRRTLDFGEHYAWRVWPYLTGGYPKRPIGVSFFEVRREKRAA
jgi:hypothetical protein